MDDYIPPPVFIPRKIAHRAKVPEAKPHISMHSVGTRISTPPPIMRTPRPKDAAPAPAPVVEPKRLCRDAILHRLKTQGPATLDTLANELAFQRTTIKTNMSHLKTEGLVIAKHKKYRLTPKGQRRTPHT